MRAGRPTYRAVLFLCTGNSARCPMAAALLEPTGRGTHPRRKRRWRR
ncbi:hypothetical protein [Mycobacterium sp.]|nr:hypothetical protein [Mycobacterium sp.]MBW0012753.1 hypothetical protein [Mycobacterium sp.]